MTVQYSEAVNNAKLDAIGDEIGAAPVLELWNGTIPVDCATADTGTKIANGTLPSVWLAPAANGVKAKAGVWSLTGLSAAGSGTMTDYFRITVGGVCAMQGPVDPAGTQNAEMTMDNLSVADGQVCLVNSFALTSANL